MQLMAEVIGSVQLQMVLSGQLIRMEGSERGLLLLVTLRERERREGAVTLTY